MTKKIIATLAVTILMAGASNLMAETSAPVQNTKPAESGASTIGLIESVLGATLGERTLTPVAVPEPATMALAGLGGLAMVMLRRRKK